MIIAAGFSDDFDVYATSGHRANAAIVPVRDVSSKQKFANRSRHRRGAEGRSFNGTHRRRNKRNYI